MSIKAIVISQLEQIRAASGKQKPKDLPPFTDDLILLDSGLDSLGVAVLVTRLEDILGFDPFTDAEMTSPPVTLGEFIRIYENAAPAS